MNIWRNWLANDLTAYIGYINEIIRNGEIAFILRGNVAWHPENVEINLDNLRLKSKLLELSGKYSKVIGSYEFHSQFCENIYEISGIKKLSFNFLDISEAKEKIKNTILEIYTLKNTISLLKDATIIFLPARIIYQKSNGKKEIVRIPRSTEEMMHVAVETSNLSKCVELSKKIERLPNKLRETIRSSISWHAQANNYNNSIGRYAYHWYSIEILANFFYQKKNKPEYEEIKKLTDSINKKNYKDIIKKCKRILEPSIMDKIISLLDLIKGGKDFKKDLFSRDSKCKLTPYEIRNKISHGVLSEYNFEEIQQFSKLFSKIQKVTKKIILTVIDEYKMNLK